jgi:signal transduction histidine kinase
MISDARVLLNLYTIFLLALLAYLGLRLRASYSALNRSHDDLELRVQERTADLALAYEELKESQVQLVQAEKMSSLGQLVAGVMHEINTPLLYVLNNASVTSDSIADVDRFVQTALPLLEAQGSDEIKTALKALLARKAEFDIASIRESAEEVATLNAESIEGLQQISDLVQSLKDFSRLDRATEDRFDVCEGIEKTLTITKNLLKYGIEVERDFEDVGEIFCSPARINQIFVNLVTNAAQAMDGEGRLRISVHAADDGVEITFEDTGCGIAEEDLSRIMDPFFTTKPVGQGTGLGLSIVHQIVQQHHGSLDVSSEVGKGTRIAVRLPRHPYSEEAA